jgi:hypothetical protein
MRRPDLLVRLDPARLDRQDRAVLAAGAFGDGAYDPAEDPADDPMATM